MPQRLLDEYTVVVVVVGFFYKAKSDNRDDHPSFNLILFHLLIFVSLSFILPFHFIYL